MFMSKNKALRAVFVVCICSMLCACNTPPATSGDSGSTEFTAESTTAQAADSTASSASQTSDSVPEASGSNSFPEFDFVPVLTEDDIEYMGIPYRELTAEQFIQLWAQCTREYNVQRLYLITYDNSSYTDELTGETVAPTELQSEQLRKELVRQMLGGEWQGRMLSMYSDVELHECEDAPDGYYDNASGEEELHYCITYNNTRYESGITGTESNTSWITLKKINGCWKIGAMKASSPYFLPSCQTEDSVSESTAD